MMMERFQGCDVGFAQVHPAEPVELGERSEIADRAACNRHVLESRRWTIRSAGRLTIADLTSGELSQRPQVADLSSFTAELFKCEQ